MNIYTIDAETSIKCPVGNHKAHPMWPLNKVVALGIYDHTKGLYEVHTTHPMAFTPDNLLVGHNIKFDLLYMYRDFPNVVMPHIWDTQLAEYILTGQKSKYASLNSLIIKYLDKDRLKDDRLKEFWDSGVNTEDIPMSILLPYLENDVFTTKDIFQQQWEVAKEQGQIPLILTQMEALRATTAMNLRGMAIDWDYVDTQRIEYAYKIE
jgi:DNA polymerase I-like protein with 3'-5' exonuclease and polymerase domains